MHDVTLLFKYARQHEALPRILVFKYMQARKMKEVFRYVLLSLERTK